MIAIAYVLTTWWTSFTVSKQYSRVPTGQGKLEEVGEFVWLGNGQGKILFLKSW